MGLNIKSIVFLLCLLCSFAFNKAHAAKFEEFTLYHEFELGMAVNEMLDEDGSYMPRLGYRFGIREKYLYFTVHDRYSYAIPKAGGENTSFNVYGLGLGVEFDIPIRLYIGANMGFSRSNASSVTYSGGSILELAYYLNPKMSIALSSETDTYTFSGTDISLSMLSLTVQWPFDIDYPSISWRKRQPTLE